MCPAYTVVLKPHGFLKYHGFMFVDRTGDWKAKYWGLEFDRLASFLSSNHFYKMKSSSMATDIPVTIITVTRKSGVTRVESQEGQGQELIWAMGTLIDGVVTHADGWYRVGSKKAQKPIPKPRPRST